MQRKKLLIVGGGNLCLQILQILAPGNAFHFHVASRDAESAARLCNLVRLGALQLNANLSIRPWQMNLVEAQIEQNAEILSYIKPDIIVNCASLQSWRVITQLPKAAFNTLDQAQLGPWLPMHLAPAYALMRAVKQSGVKAMVVNMAFPDAVNTVLDKIGLAPHVGAGNLANLVPATRCAIAMLARCEPDAVRVKLIGQHFFSHFVPRGGLPAVANFHLRYWINGVESTGRFSAERIFASVSTDFRRLGGVDGQFLTATSAVNVICGLHALEETETHAPGPHGLPGGYPVRIGMGQIVLSLPHGITRAEAISTNQLCQRQDGIEMIHPDGSVSFGSEQMAVMESSLGFFMAKMQISEASDRAAELAAKYKAFADNLGKQGVTAHVVQSFRASYGPGRSELRPSIPAGVRQPLG
ncbi:hypothetical protein [Pseudomonas huanghezhanensis]|uniref:hypothetical protein n=1 Tax=Pseudomonas huanghezhanensis TaxID=3002903 RepID=UPI002285E9B1|nr:hypothetical protein [Pseudomonas sp. BSw22131]